MSANSSSNSRANDKVLCVLLLTYNRREYAEKTLRSALDNIQWSGTLNVHIADDGSPAGYVDALRRIAGGYDSVAHVGSSCSDRRGYGANYNLATQHIHAATDFVLPLEDDWVLTSRLDCDTLSEAFVDTRIGCVRLGYLGATQELYAELLRVDGHAYWLLDAGSAEPHVFAGHPRLETVEWERAQGPWVEGLDPNRTEFEVAYHVRSGIAWPCWLSVDGGLFAHIGTERSR